MDSPITLVGPPGLCPNEYLQNLQKQFTGTIEVLRTLYTANEELKRALDDAQLDLRNVTEHSRNLQRTIVALEGQLDAAKSIDYALVLIDGDGMIFNTKFIAEGRAGGRVAARNLHEEAKKHLSGIELVIRVYANVDGLARALKKAGHISTETVFRDFVIGFSDPCNERCDFVDVGDGKEMADEKLKSELKWHLKNPNCQRVLFGASHDNGYARVLSSIDQSRLQLLEGPPFARELEALTIPHVRFSNIFSTSKIDIFANLPPTTPSVQPPTSTSATIAPPPGPTPPVATQKFSYAATAAAAASTTPPPSPKPVTAQPATVTVSRDAVLRVKALNPKPCNNHYLKGECIYDDCYFGHSYKLKAEDIAVMRRLAASKKCVWGNECSSEKCFYSHESDVMTLGGLM